MPSSHSNYHLRSLFLLALLILAGCSARAGAPARPNAVAVAPDGSLWVMDLLNHQVVHLSPDGRRLGAFGRLGTAPDQIYQGWGMALDGAGNAYLCDQRTDAEDLPNYESVKVFTPRGRLVRELVAADDDGGNGCYSVHVDKQGRVLVTYANSNQLRIFNSDGTLLATFWGKIGNGPGEFEGLYDVAWDSRRNLLYATDTANSRIQQFDVDVSATGAISLTHRLTYGSYGSGPGELNYPRNLAVDEASGLLYVGDMANRRIQVFDPEGQVVRQFAPPGIPEWQVLGLAVGPDGAVYAADAFNSAIWVFEPNGQVRKRIEVKS